MRIDGRLGNGEAQAETALLSIETHKGRERLLDLAALKATAAILDLASRGRVLHRVPNKAAQRRANEPGVEHDALVLFKHHANRDTL